MPRISLAGFKDPVRRPRYIIWTGVAVLVLAAVMIVALGVTSTRWFCSEGCHKVQDDTILAYQASSHSEISCMACHMPVNANPVVFILHKAEALGELYMTVTDNYELPLNPHSEVSLTMVAKQCTQCHNLETRPITPSGGIKIDHAKHAEVNAACPVCHNRVAHVENFELTLNNPEKQGGEPNEKHEDFMEMTACFRCHSLEKDGAAPGTCSACHPKGFELKPENHEQTVEVDGKQVKFFPKGHGQMALEAEAEASGTSAEGEAAEGAEATEGGAAEGEAAEGEEAAEGGETDVAALLEEEKAAGASEDHSIGEELPTVDSIFYCGTCHQEKFCNDCHGMEMPHPAEFKEPKDPKDPNGHPVMSKTKAKKCVMCHQPKVTQFCNECHHGKQAGGWEYKKTQPWTEQQHPKAVAAGGVKACTTKCHTTKFCLDCHTGKAVVPSSHRAAYWTKPKAPGAVTDYGKTPAKASAGHTKAAQESMETCAVCHGSGGTDAKFCKNCHKMETPHPAEFKKNHVSAKKNQAPCRNCHLFRELCSNCHHVDSSTKVPWLRVHGASVNKNGFSTCTEKCHPEKKDCVNCHTSRNVRPSSHNKKNFVRDYSTKKASHVQLYNKEGEVCTFCHQGDAAKLPSSKFCNGCHRTAMPHPDGYGPPEGAKPTSDNGGQHAADLKSKKVNKAICRNCHQTSFCNSCHHQGAPAGKPWVRSHPTVVKKSGAQACFDCHEETYCSDCHVNRAADIMGR